MALEQHSDGEPARGTASLLGPEPAYGRSRADVLLRDGTVATVRAVGPGDTEALRELHARLGPTGYRLRFFGTGVRLGEDYVRHVAASSEVVALLVEQAGRVIALATAEPIGSARAELSFVVAEDAHGRGIGTLLLEHVAAEARRRGFVTLTAEVMAENGEMLDVLARAGFATSYRQHAGTVELSLDSALSPGVLAAADARDRAAEAQSLWPLLHPRSVAVAGVRADGTGVGSAILRSIVAGAFDGAVAVVHPSLHGVGGIRAWRRFADIPGGVDLAVVAVPAPRVLDVLNDAAAGGVRSVVIVSSGFEDSNGEGARAKQAILELARRTSMRVVGPNCLGILCHAPGGLLDATFGDRIPPQGPVAVASQSGGVGIALLDAAHELSLGLRYFVSLGDKVDVSGNDLLAAWTDDEDVHAAALYLESFGNPLRFARVARTFALRKPLLAVLGGRSASGARAGASHTAAAATPGAHVRALFAETGVIECADAAEIAETALMLTCQPLPAGRRIGVLSNAGGMGVIAADLADELALTVPPFSAAVRHNIGDECGGIAGSSNPVDAGAAATATQMETLASAMLASGEIDALLVVLVPTRVSDGGEAVRRLLMLARGRHDRPVAVVALGSLWARTWPPGSPAYPSMEAALGALAHAATYAAWRREPAAPPPSCDRERARAGAALAQTLIGTHGHARWLSAGAIADLLAPYGLAPIGAVVHGEDAAVAAASAAGFPVAVKAATADVVHKSERGLVRLGLRSRDAVRTAVRQIGELAGADGSVLVQPMSTGREIALGIVRDDRFGPLVMVAAGGLHTEVWNDRTFLLPPISRDAALRAVRGLRMFPLLAGHRGEPPADVEALVDLIVQVGLLAEEVPEVIELDVNPVHVDDHGCRIVDVKVRLATARDLDAGVPRRLSAHA